MTHIQELRRELIVLESELCALETSALVRASSKYVYDSQTGVEEMRACNIDDLRVEIRRLKRELAAELAADNRVTLRRGGR